MSKSLGNFFTVRDLLDKGVAGEVIRFVMLSTHYRKPMDWTEKKRQEAEATLRKWYAQAEQALDNSDPHPGVVAAISDDLNTASAITELHVLSKSDDVVSLRASLKFLGFLDKGVPDWAKGADLGWLADRLLDLRDKAMETKDFSALDAFKTALTEAGVEVRMSKTGVELAPAAGFDPAKLEGLK